MEADVSDRLIEQRVRNRIIEVVEIITMGDEGVRIVGVKDYFNFFFDWTSRASLKEAEAGISKLTTLTEEEKRRSSDLYRQVEVACVACSEIREEQALIRSGWPSQLRGPASELLRMMLAHGRYSEETEEKEPSPI